jgi:hypothetical protein
MYWYSCRPYIPQAVQLSSTYEYIHASTVYSRLECEGGIPPRAHSNREWQSNRIECSKTEFVPKGGESMVELTLIASGNLICAF